MRARKALCLLITTVLALFLCVGLLQTRALAEGSERISENRTTNEQDFFYRTIEVARTSTNSVIYGGSNTVLSRKALNAVGGFFTESITEDFATGLLIESAGFVSLGMTAYLRFRRCSPPTLASSAPCGETSRIVLHAQSTDACARLARSEGAAWERAQSQESVSSRVWRSAFRSSTSRLPRAKIRCSCIDSPRDGAPLLQMPTSLTL